MRTKPSFGLLLLSVIAYISLPANGLAAEKHSDVQDYWRAKH